MDKSFIAYFNSEDYRPWFARYISYGTGQRYLENWTRVGWTSLRGFWKAPASDPTFLRASLPSRRAWALSCSAGTVFDGVALSLFAVLLCAPKDCTASHLPCVPLGSGRSLRELPSMPRGTKVFL